MALIQALRTMNSTNVITALGLEDCSTPAMKVARNNWRELYFNKTATCNSNPNMQLPFTIVQKLHKTIFAEYTAVQSGDGNKADNTRLVIEELNRCKKEAMQHALMVGECLIKPILNQQSGGFDFTVIQAHNYFTIGRGKNKRATGYVLQEITMHGKHFYTLVEVRTVDDKGILTIESKLFKSQDRYSTGSQVPLTSLGK